VSTERPISPREAARIEGRAWQAPSTPHLSIGRVIAASLGLVRRRWLAVALIVAAWWMLGLGEHYAHHLWPDRGGAHDPRGFALREAVYVVDLALRWTLDAALVAVALQPPGQGSVTKALGVALKAFPALLPFRIVSSFLSVSSDIWLLAFANLPDEQLGYIELGVSAVLVLTGLMMTAAWGVIVPVVLAERRSPITAFSRSWRLLAGNRWKLVILSVLMGAIQVAPAFLVAPLAALFREPHAFHLYLQYVLPIAGAVGSIVEAIWLVMTAVAYMELRWLKEGATPAEAVEVFG
jgi:hypothetical protein